MTKNTPRLLGLDIIRGAMILIMILYHGWYLLAHVILWLEPLENGICMRLFTGIGGAVFVGIAGLSAAMTWWRRREASDARGTFARHCLQRAAILAILAALITFLTDRFEPSQRILFGILHFFSIGFLLLPLFSEKTKLNYWLSGAMIALWVFGFMTTFPVEHLWIFGFRSASFMSADYYPLFPYFGVLLFGFALGKTLLERGCFEVAFSWYHPVFRPLVFLGRHSLVIYLLHVPVLYGVFWLIFMK